MLDAKTLFTCLMVAELAGSAILASLYVFWKHPDPETKRSTGLWALTYFLGGIGTFLLGLRGILPDSMTLILANFLILFGTGLRRSAIAVFFRVPTRLWIAAAVAGTWVVLCFVPQFRNSLVARVDFNEAMMITLVMWTVWIVVRNNREKLYTPGIYALSSVIECAAYAGMVIYFNTSTYPSYLASFQSFFLPYLLLTILVTMVLSMITVVAMTIERSLLQFRQEAHEDPLTGLPNRRAFFEKATKLHGNLPDGSRFALILFNLDKFRTVNETFGHAMGDAVLRLFGSVCREAAAPHAVTGYLQGDAFVVYLDRADTEEAETYANQLARRFAINCRESTKGRLKVDVSAGVAVAHAVNSVERALEVAQRGLYHAKKADDARLFVLGLCEEGQIREAVTQGYARLKPGLT